MRPLLRTSLSLVASCPLAFLVPGLAACSAVPARAPAPALRASLPIAYRASLGSSAKVPGVVPDRAPLSPLTWPRPDPAPTRATELELLLLALPAAEAAALERSEDPSGPLASGPGVVAGPHAWTAEADGLLAWLQLDPGGDARVLEAGRFLATAEHPARLSQVEQRAYVADYDLRGDARFLIADPKVDVLDLGLLLQVSLGAAEDADEGASDAAHLVVSITQANLARELEAEPVDLLGSTVHVTLQRPLVLTQQLDAEARLAPDECLALAWPHPDDAGLRLVALVRARARAR